MYEHLRKVIEILKNKQNEDKKSQKFWYDNYFNEERQGTQICMVRYEELRRK